MQIGKKDISIMIQSAASTSTPMSLGVENLARFGSQETQSGGRGRAPGAAPGGSQLTPEQQRQVDALKQTDRKVRAHEQAHLSAGAELVRGGPSFTYTTGPDGRRYAVAGEVSIDTTPGRTPEDTVPKARHIRAAALAPADPSVQDRSVAAQASQMERQALQALVLQQSKAAAESAGNGSARTYSSAGRGDSQENRVGVRLDLYA